MASCLTCAALECCQCASCMACSCFSSALGATMSQAARFGHLLVVVVTFTFAVILGIYYPEKIYDYSSQYSEIEISDGCNPAYLDDCVYRQLIYRASFALALTFAALAVISYFSEYANKSFWAMKFAVPMTVFIGFWWGSNHAFSGWAELVRVLSFFWLLVQGFLLFDFAHDTHGMR